LGGIGQVGQDPYPLAHGSTIAIKYSMTRRVIANVLYKKDGFLKHEPVPGTNAPSGYWTMLDYVGLCWTLTINH
jgi:hypothetical protein